MIVVHLTTMFVYDTIGIALVTIFMAIGLLWREAAAQPRRPGGPIELASPTLGGYGTLVRSNARVIMICAALGLVGGIAVQYELGVPATSTTTILLPTDSAYLGSPIRRRLSTRSRHWSTPRPCCPRSAKRSGDRSLRTTAT